MALCRERLRSLHFQAGRTVAQLADLNLPHATLEFLVYKVGFVEKRLCFLFSLFLLICRS